MSYTPSDLVMDTAEEFGQHVAEDEADFILWEYTGFPGFFIGDPEVAVRRQLAAYFIRRLAAGGDPDA